MKFISTAFEFDTILNLRRNKFSDVQTSKMAQIQMSLLRRFGYSILRLSEENAKFYLIS